MPNSESVRIAPMASRETRSSCAVRRLRPWPTEGFPHSLRAPRRLAAILLILVTASASRPSESPEAILHVPALDSVRIDGDASDWRDQGLVVDLLTPNGPERPAPADLDGRARLAWDERGLLVLIQVTDDQILEAHDEGSLWTGDGAEVFLASRRGGSDAVQYLVAPGVSPEFTALRWRLNDCRTTPALKDLPAEAELASQKTADGYALEVRMPWAALGVAPAAGVEAACQFYINDVDEDEALRRLLFFPGEQAHSDLLAYHRVLLDRESSPPLNVSAGLELDPDPAAPTVVRVELRYAGVDAPAELRSGGIPLARAPLVGPGTVKCAAFRVDAQAVTELAGGLEVVAGDGSVRPLSVDPAYLQARPVLERAAWVVQAAAEGSLPAHKGRAAAMVLAWHDMLGQLLFDGGRDLSEVRKRVRGVPNAVAELQRALDDYGRRGDAYRRKRGGFLSAYLSAVDGSGQVYGLYVPPDYDDDDPWPLHVVMHGYGGTYGGPPNPNPPPEYLMAFVDGRGQTGYAGLGERDVLEVIADVRRHYRVDPDRIYARGGSMGGRGTWTVAARHPDLFAAALPDYGWADGLFLGNLANLPLWNFHDDTDWGVPVDHSRAAVGALRRLGCPVIHSEAPGGGHSTSQFRLGPERQAWLTRQVRDPYPRLVRHTAWHPYQGRSYWVEIARFSDPNRPAAVLVRAQPANQLFLSGDNVSEVRLELPAALFDAHAPLTVVGHGDPLTVAAPLPEHLSLRLDRDGVPQAVLAGAGPPPAVRPYIAGGLHYLWSGGEPLLIVRPTGGDPALRDSIAAFALLLARENGSWYEEPMPMGHIPAKDDVDVTPADHQERNLILLGPPASNRVLAGLMDRLPVREQGGRVFVDGQELPLAGRGYVLFCYNPEAPRRYLGVLASSSPACYRVEANELVRAVNDEAPLGFRLFAVEPVRHTVRQILWNAAWMPDQRAGDRQPVPGRLATAGAWQEALAAAVVRTTGSDFLLDQRPPDPQAPVWDAAATRWHDLRVELDRPWWFYRTQVSGHELVALQATVRDSLEGMALYPQVRPDRIAAGRSYGVVMASWTAWELVGRLHRNLGNVEWLPVASLWAAFRDESLGRQPQP
ncbi:MAG: sugar-binding protein [Candidatus Latescibacterota bacterium]